MEFRNSQRDNELLKEKETEMAAAHNVSAVMQLNTQAQILHCSFICGKHCAYFTDDGKNSCELYYFKDASLCSPRKLGPSS